MEKTTTKRVTKAQRFEDIKAMLNGETVLNGSTLEDAIVFIDKEVDLLARKNTAERKPTKTQEQNEEYKTLILSYMSGQTETVTCTDIRKGVPEFVDFNSQKIAALVRQLCESGQLVKSVVKGQARFHMA